MECSLIFFLFKLYLCIFPKSRFNSSFISKELLDLGVLPHSRFFFIHSFIHWITINPDVLQLLYAVYGYWFHTQLSDIKEWYTSNASEDQDHLKQSFMSKITLHTDPHFGGAKINLKHSFKVFRCFRIPKTK